MSTPSPRSVDQVAQQLRSLADALTTSDPNDPAWEDVGQHLEAAQALLPNPAGDRPDAGGRQWLDSSVFAGALNVVAPPMVVRSEPDDESGETRLPVLSATVTLGPRYEGPSGAVHGGIIAGMLDELLGAAASRLGQPVVTGTLKLRYPGRTPLHQPLQLRAWVTDDQRHAVMASASVSFDGVTTAEAKAMFVRVRLEESDKT